VEGLVEGETVGITYLGMRHLNVGEYPNDIEISFAPEEIYFRSRGAGIAADGELPTAKAGNYTVVALSIGTLKITGWEIPVQSITIKAASGEKVYDGTPLTNGEYTVEGLPSGYTVEVTVEGSQTVTGSTPNKITGYVIRNAYGHVETGSFTVKTVNGTLTVKPAPLTVTADSAEKLYDGTPLVKDSYTSTALAEGDSFVSVTVTGSQTEPGTSANVASAAKIVNAGGEDVTFCYEIAYADGTLRVRDETEDIDDDDTPLGPGEDNVVEEPDEPIYNPNNVPSTGDGSNIPAWAGLSVLALIGLAVVSFRRRKKEDED
ncbi:MAG: LPXTG cell wall anchor domain-containing protein, partial [Oscillospiraceae bacterium]|nr:LPXTG cell wall anchor domain-containing protein [Oscillospiraceae bacterium]